MKILKQYDNYIEVQLDNGNTMAICEVESGLVHLTNTTPTTGQYDLNGLNLYPIGISTIAITPEG